MKRSRFFLFCLPVLIASVIGFNPSGLAKIPEPSAVYYGNVTVGAISVTAENTAVQVSLRIGDKIVSNYQMGSNTELGDQYILVVPMDAVGEREPNSGRQGDVATILVMGNEAETFMIDGKGKFVQKHLSVIAEDSDNDGLPDLWENQNGLDPFDASDAALDPDEDGLDNSAEYAAGTDPNNADSDGDGMNDGYEITHGFDPNDNSDAAGDADGDGYTNLEEAQNGTNPTVPNETQPFRIQIARTISGHNGNIAALVLNNDKVISASQHEAAIRIWNIADGTLDSSTDSGTINGINAMVISGSLLFAGTGDSTVLLYETAGVDPLLDDTYSDAQGSILALATHNNKLIAGSADGSAYVWDTPTRMLETSWQIHEVDASADPGNIKFISGVGASDNQIYTLESFPSKSLKMWNWSEKQNMLTISASQSCCDLTNLHLDGDTIFISNIMGPNKISAFSLQNLISPKQYEGTIGNGAALAESNHRFFSGDENGMINIWGTTSSSHLLGFKAHDQPIKSIVATDTLLITGDASGLIKIWNLFEDVAGDTDFDGMDDSWESTNGLNPNDPADKSSDPDSDGLTNIEEYINQTDPRSPDTDSDLMPDKWELDYGLNPKSDLDAALDSDSDGLTNLQEYDAGTNPKNADTDGDQMPDKWEVDNGLDPNDPADAALDPDVDGFTNLQEYQNGTDPNVF
ncbi:MAG: hypothetical protein MI922_20720 [Bacteroidales bacterium]|nr:hypothetical protein [Bacteroidales bacterium]